VRLSVCPIYQQHAAGLLQGAPWTGNIDRAINHSAAAHAVVGLLL